MILNKHGSFYIRNGWPTKIMDVLETDPYIFSPNNELPAVDMIGVGRVMIRAMRYWATVLGIADEEKAPSGVKCNLTKLAATIKKYDPYCLCKGTLWLLHRNLAQDIENATAWSWAFNRYDASSFTKEDFSAAFYSYIQREGGSYAKSAVEKEFDCFKNTYVSELDFDVLKIIEEDTVPFFAPLKLIEHKGNGLFERNKVRIKEIPLYIFFYCIYEDNRKHFTNNRQIEIDLFMEQHDQVCKYMNLSYSMLLELLQQLENVGLIHLVNNFGNRYVEMLTTDIDCILENYYQLIGR